MELDHIFIFIQEHDQLTASLKRFGLREGTPNVHAGQGTACKRFFFQNAYLELVWVRDAEEIKSAVIAKAKLWERSQYRLTNYCPFGLCFRAATREDNSIMLLFEDAWRYYPAFLPEGQFANIASNENFPDEPMLFEMPFFGLAPKDYPLEKQQLLSHKMGFKEITKVSLILPTSTATLSLAMKKVLDHSIVNVLEGKAYHITIEFDYGLKKEAQNFYPLSPLTLQW